MQHELAKRDVVLLGAGHTNAHVLRMWRMQPLPETSLTCVSNFGVAAYSGMLPGTLAGQYESAEMQIDLVRLCAAVGARLINGEVTGLDLDNQKLLFAKRPPLPFDALSIGVGSRPTEIPGNDALVVPIKPMQTFLPRLEQRLSDLSKAIRDRAIRIAIIGGGAGGFEVACCLSTHLALNYPAATFQLSLVNRGKEILKTMPRRTIKLARNELQRRNVTLVLGREISAIHQSGKIDFDEGASVPADLTVWATSARAPEVLNRLDLQQDDRGFLLTRDTLQCNAADSVFAVGDAGTVDEHRTAKAGVYAVRQGPVLWENLQRYLAGQNLRKWQPQASFLTLLNTGDGRAILSYKATSIHAGWCWWLKDRIDRRFMAKYQDYTPRMVPTAIKSSAKTMHCGGCGCKLSADVLERTIGKLHNPTSDRLVQGLSQPDDVAIIDNSTSHQTAITTDFFTAFTDDPHLLGQVAAENALSDLYASGAEPTTALAMVIVPFGPPNRQEQFLLEVLEGALQRLRPAGVPIVGGHSIEGPLATVGFTLLGDITEEGRMLKSGLQPGDQVVLTKPLGTGALLAGHQQALCQADWMGTLVDSMLASNREASLAARSAGIHAVTDVTGFGLARHLREMVRASGTSVTLDLNALPILPGAIEIANQDIESTLAPSNRSIDQLISAAQELRRSPRYAMIFDPQTSGGLLMGVPREKLTCLLERLPATATVIGRITKPLGETPSIKVQ